MSDHAREKASPDPILPSTAQELKARQEQALADAWYLGRLSVKELPSDVANGPALQALCYRDTGASPGAGRRLLVGELKARMEQMQADLHEIRHNHPGNQLVTLGAGKFSRWADTVRDLLAACEAQEQEKNQKGDTRMAMMGDSDDNLTAATVAPTANEPPCALNHDAIRSDIRRNVSPPCICPSCGWTLRATRAEEADR